MSGAGDAGGTDRAGSIQGGAGARIFFCAIGFLYAGANGPDRCRAELVTPAGVIEREAIEPGPGRLQQVGT